MNIEIKKINGEILLSGKYATIKEALEKIKSIDLAGADLVEVDLSGAYLAGANLARANLTGACLTETNLDIAYIDGAKGV
jgi:uncharacterized protein YjbI with pentapeptide repeats